MIGVFDSGFGGLTVHRALTRALPGQDFVYLGDNRNAPYSPRPPIDVLTLTCVGVEKLFEAGCDLVIVACNTASTVALRWMQQTWLPAQARADGRKRNILGIVVPTIEAVVTSALPQHATIGIFATERTVATGTYPTEIHKRRPDLTVVQQACPTLVRLIEDGAPREVIRGQVHNFVGALHAQLKANGQNWPDRVILGCTHYPLVVDLFAEALPPGLPLIDQPDATAHALADYLARHPEYDPGSTGQRRFLSTGYAPEALPEIERFWGGPLVFETV